MTKSELTGKIKQYATDLGFCKVGVARAERLEGESARLSEWLARGYHGTMHWMESKFTKRVDPQEVLPHAQSIISVALNYYTDVQHNQEACTPKVSRYAWGDDYHHILGGLLDKLLVFIKTLDETANGRIYVDTGPVMEKVWAQRAGIGWEGKHTNVITQEYGSWVFLGEILLDRELEYDTPAVDHCGSCNLCIEACPTKAIIEPYVLDSNRCISYLTIEHRGEIPFELGEQFEGWIYGCDICQDVCPWNQKFSSATTFSEFLPRDHNREPDVQEILKMSQEDFEAGYGHSAMKRTKISGLKRNAQVLVSTSHI